MPSTSVSDIANGSKPPNPVASFSRFLESYKPQLALALPKHLNADRMARLAVTAFAASQDLQKCTPQSIVGALMTAGQLGLEPGVGGQAYLIPYHDRRRQQHVCTFVPGWKGLVDLVSRAGRATVWTGAVMPGDEFDYQLGDAPYCRHKPGDEVGGKWTHVYAIGRVNGAQMPVIEVWTRAKVTAHLNTYNKVGDRHYAKASENNFLMYGRKVALLQVLKYMPQSIELQTAMRVADMADTGQGVVLEGEYARFVDGDPAGSAPPGGTADPDTGEIATPPAPPETRARSYAVIAQAIQDATSAETAALELDAARDELPAEQHAELVQVFRNRWGA